MSDCLIDARSLAERLRGEEPPVLVDCRFDLAHPEAGREAYMRGHLPTACYAHLDADLSGPASPASGRHPLPDHEDFAARCRAWGIGPGRLVVAYDDAGGAYAARLWWLLHWLGHAEAVVLDGGIQAWMAEGYALEQDEATPRVGEFTGYPRAERVLDAETLQSLLHARRCRLIDVRTEARFKGHVEPIDPVAGHVPGAVNHPYNRLLSEDGRFLPPEALRAQIEAVLAGVSPDEAVAMCGSGVTACHLLLAMAHAGLPGARLYAGSWSEWIRNPERPVSRIDR
ncbi:hypothetical protein BJI67_13710 [Acidihalobacter aeolianus]|uniref:Sulfurtransferase n=1 Tax=Acidihalobacter aeolianus TaxID=2792603 RepID=A0A1D8KAI9_9GAMM|nr:sulfurtransferase [Acidihalobacter aeolianus]AOV17974.1 hypothetical protein BJI67_13710 [Acidihalobacter aeolianus]